MGANDPFLLDVYSQTVAGVVERAFGEELARPHLGQIAGGRHALRQFHEHGFVDFLAVVFEQDVARAGTDFGRCLQAGVVGNDAHRCSRSDHREEREKEQKPGPSKPHGRSPVVNADRMSGSGRRASGSFQRLAAALEGR